MNNPIFSYLKLIPDSMLRVKYNMDTKAYSTTYKKTRITNKKDFLNLSKY